MSDFNFFVEANVDDDILKSSAKEKGDKRYKNMIISGLASDNTKDKQGEILEPAGYDFEPFLKTGLINLEHYTSRKGSSRYWIGEPLEAEVKGDKFFIKSKLWEKHPEARAFWDTLIAMRESGSKRRPGYSIEGKAIEKDPINPKRITKATINHCAVTFSPVNSNSWLDIVKGEQKEDFVEHEQIAVDGFSPFLLKFEKDGKIITILPDFSIDIKNKAMDVAAIKPLIKESLRKKVLTLQQVGKIAKSLIDGNVSVQTVQKIIKRL